MEVKFRIMVANFRKVRIKVKYYWLLGKDDTFTARNLLRLPELRITNYNVETENEINKFVLCFTIFFVA